MGWDLRGEREVLGEANACGTAGAAASAVKRNKRNGVGKERRRRRRRWRTWLEKDQMVYKTTPLSLEAPQLPSPKKTKVFAVCTPAFFSYLRFFNIQKKWNFWTLGPREKRLLPSELGPALAG